MTIGLGPDDFSALASRVRWAILSLIGEPERALTYGEIVSGLKDPKLRETAGLGTEEISLPHHLKRLVDAGFLMKYPHQDTSSSRIVPKYKLGLKATILFELYRSSARKS